MKLQRQTVSEQAAQLLRGQILDGTLRPGDVITEDAIASTMGVSRPTMRGVLGLLATEGLLTRNESTRILHVTRVNREEVRQIFIARRLLEVAGVEAAAHATPEELETLEHATQQLVAAVAVRDGLGIVQADIACHVATVAFLRSPHLEEFYERLLNKLQLSMAEFMRTPDDRASTNDVHLDFVKLLRSGDIQAARAHLIERLDAAERLQLGAAD